MTEAKDLKQKILEEAPRMKLSDRFRFACHPGVPCFNDCCADINIVLTPYDILRLKKRLSISSGEFIERYALLPFSKEITQPVPILKMLDDEKKRCPFVGPEGCTVYEDRPWACRMYPIGLAAPRDEAEQGERFYFLMEESHCKGFAEEGEFSIGGWIEDQGIRPYDEAGDLFKGISLHPGWGKGDLSPAQMDMFFSVAYDLDRFRRFVFESSFLEKFELSADEVEAMRDDDEALMQFGFRWLHYALFYEPTMKLNDEFEGMKKREKDFFDKKEHPDGEEC